METIYLYHTNDLHSHLSQWPKIVHYLEHQKQYHSSNREQALFFDLGDHADRVHPVTEATSGRGNVELLNDSPIQYATIGNNEGITFSKEGLDRLYQQAKFKVILSNLYDQDGKRPSWAEPTQVHTLNNGVRLGFIGLTAAFYPFYEKLGWSIEHPLANLERELPKLQKQADTIIVLSHLGFFMDEQIAEDFDVDVILGAHTHHRLDPAPTMNGTLITQTGKLGTDVGKVELSFSNKQLVRTSGSLIPITATAADSHKALQTYTRLQAETLEILAEEIGTSDERLEISWTHPSAFSSFVVEHLREWCGVDMAMMHSGLLLASLREGSMTRRDLHHICPHPINPAVVTLSGQQLIEAVHRSFTERMVHLPLKGYGFRGIQLGVMVFAGMEVGYEFDDVNGYNVTHITKQGERIVPELEYNVAVPDMLTFGTLYPEVAASTNKQYFMPELLRDVIAWAFTSKTNEQ
ncbi:5'-nucleotidase family protein [Geomicrobium sp. JCM 19039]|nr:5'-nucleotidase family protein [Geomicrobium sp. JCM 19039]